MSLPPAQLAAHSLALREWIIKMLAKAGSGHPAGALGMADVFATLYCNVLQHRPTEPEWPDRDYVLLSNGHINPVLYASLALGGYFPVEQLLTLRQLGSPLQGHPKRGAIPGIETTSGPLGQGLSQACGLAAALKLEQRTNHVYCVLSDGEHDEGQTWEAYGFGAKERLDNLTAIIDRNQIQIDGRTEDVLPLEPFMDKLLAFGWEAIEIDGHDFDQIQRALTTRASGRPVAVVCRTVPGRGVAFMENQYQWHGKAPSAQEAEAALAQLATATQLTAATQLATATQLTVSTTAAIDGQSQEAP